MLADFTKITDQHCSFSVPSVYSVSRAMPVFTALSLCYLIDLARLLHKKCKLILTTVVSTHIFTTTTKQRMKNLRTLIPALICAVAFFASCNNKTAEETSAVAVDSTGVEAIYTVNTDSTSFVFWKGVMLGVKEHTGKVLFKDGSVTVKGAQLVAGSFTVDLGSIALLDTNYNEKAGYGKAKLIGHLSSPDFFDVANFSTASFVVKTVNGNSATGTLTVRGKANDETLSDIVVTETDGALKASGKLKFNRKKYDVKFDMPMKDMVISNDIELNIELTGKK